MYQAKMAKWKNDQKLANSLKTANERRQDSEVTARDDFQDAGAIANLKYGEFDMTVLSMSIETISLLLLTSLS